MRKNNKRQNFDISIDAKQPSKTFTVINITNAEQMIDICSDKIVIPNKYIFTNRFVHLYQVSNIY